MLVKIDEYMRPELSLGTEPGSEELEAIPNADWEGKGIPCPGIFVPVVFSPMSLRVSEISVEFELW